MIRGQWASERGAAALETAALIPILVLSALVALQVGVAGWTVTSTGQAARDGARAASLGNDPVTAAERSLPGSLEPTDVTARRTGDGREVTVTVEVPSLAGFTVGEVSRTSEMPVVR